MNSGSNTGTVTFLFTDIEGSTRLWEADAARMSAALARHDELARRAIETHRGAVVKMLGDGACAVFDDPADAIRATLNLQSAFASPEATSGIPLRVRCGLHSGPVERRDNDYFGTVVNRVSRIMSAAHGGQVLLSQSVVDLVGHRWPASASVRDLGNVRLRDLATPERVYQLVHPQLRQEFPALRSLESTPNNLPQQVSSFVGRDHELIEVTRGLEQTRLLTLSGVGGIGKTRLSLQVAADVIDDYVDGVWFVELAPLGDTRLVPQAVASVLGVKEEAGRPVIEALVKYVKDRQLLLILDNCEHLLDACAALAKQLLQSSPRLKVLASSREHLHVAGERSYQVPALAVPNAQKQVTVAALTKYEAVRLFVERAIAVQSAFRVTNQNATAVADICQRLDGIPLAIELAAARVRALSVENIAARLSDRFRLLTGGDHTTLPRQQTLRTSIDWSYDLLSVRERVLLQRLSVFAGGWTLKAAEAVGKGGDLNEMDVLDLLTQLVEKSLVVLETQGERYRLLETVREYAQERLNESGEEDEARTRHLAFYLALAEEAQPQLSGSEQGAWFAQLDLERENLLSAHAWCDRAKGGAELGLRLVDSVGLYWLPRGLLELGHRVTVDALTRVGAQERSLARCQALHTAGHIGYNVGRYEEAKKYLEESLSVAQELGDENRVGSALRLLGMVSCGQGDLATAREHFEGALALGRALGHKHQLSAALGALAELHRGLGDLDAAEPLYQESLTLFREWGDRGNSAAMLLNLAIVSLGRGSGDRARVALLEALAIAEEVGSKYSWQGVPDVCVAFAAFLGEWETAARLYGVAEAQGEQMGYHRDLADEAFLAPLVARAREELGAVAFAAAETAGRALSYEAAMVEARAWLENRP